MHSIHYYIIISKVAGTADNPLYDVSPFAGMKAEDVSNTYQCTHSTNGIRLILL